MSVLRRPELLAAGCGGPGFCVCPRRRIELRLAELERFQKLTVGRELKMIELKKEVEELKRQLTERTVPAGMP